jgi:peptide-methionine (S)-S-oxide reductase
MKHGFTMRKICGLVFLVALFGTVPAFAVNVPSPKYDPKPDTPPGTLDKAVLAGGCFWGMQELYSHVKGVTNVVAGYAGDLVQTAHYDIVSKGHTRQAETVQITYDPTKISYGQLLKIFFAVAHDPTQVNQQGPDIGPQYRSAIFYASPKQQRIAQEYIDLLRDSDAFSQFIATELVPLKGFYKAEDYHQDYAAQHPTNPYVMINDLPKLDQLKAQFPDLYVE